VASFHGSGCGEGPARSALLLVLDWGDSSFGSPIPGSRGSLLAERLWVSHSLVGGGIDDGSHEVGLELFAGQVGEFIDSNGVGEVQGIVGIDEVDGILEDSESVVNFVVFVGLGEFGSEFHPHLEVLSLGASASDICEAENC